MADRFDVIVVGGGLAGLVATHELVKAGKRVAVLEQENEQNLGGQAFWSLGGLFFVDSPEQPAVGSAHCSRAARPSMSPKPLHTLRIRPRAR